MTKTLLTHFLCVCGDYKEVISGGHTRAHTQSHNRASNERPQKRKQHAPTAEITDRAHWGLRLQHTSTI